MLFLQIHAIFLKIMYMKHSSYLGDMLKAPGKKQVQNHQPFLLTYVGLSTSPNIATLFRAMSDSRSVTESGK